MPLHKAEIVEARAPQPFAQVGGDAVEPDALDRRGQLLMVACRYLGDDRVKRLPGAIDSAAPDREQAFPPEPGEQLELDIIPAQRLLRG